MYVLLHGPNCVIPLAAHRVGMFTRNTVCLSDWTRQAPIYFKIATQRFEIAGRALARHEALHRHAGRIVDKDQQRAGLVTVLRPAVV